MTVTLEDRIVVLAPFGRDAQVIAEIVGGIVPVVAVSTAQQLLTALNEGAAAAVVTEETLSVAQGSPVHLWLRSQPAWSDFPFVVLTSKSSGRRALNAATSLHLMGNVILLERPVSPDTLKVAVEAARRARTRQYATRAMLSELAAAHGQVEELNRDLEGRIQERTRELSDANNRLMTEIGERERAQTALLQVQKMEAIGQLTGGIAHDFNNLLHAIGLNLDLLSRLQCPPQAERVVEVVRKTVRRGARLTEQLLSFARSHSLVPQVTDLHVLITGMQDLLSTSVGSSIHVALQLNHGHPMVQVDPNQLEMAILNLAVNARDAMPKGGSITISTSELASPTGPAGGRGVMLTIGDNGEGIPPSIIERVFEPFFTTKPMGSGTGLGLAQVYGFIKQSGGDVKIESTPGVGTKVHLLFTEIAEDLLLQSTQVNAPRVTPRQKILVVEDDDDVRLSIVQSLEILGHEVTSVSDGAAALSVLDKQQPTLLVVDYVMPGMNGADLIRRVQQRWPDIAVILATGYADMDKVAEVVGARSVLKKPFRVEALAEAVHLAVA